MVIDFENGEELVNKFEDICDCGVLSLADRNWLIKEIDELVLRKELATINKVNLNVIDTVHEMVEEYLK